MLKLVAATSVTLAALVTQAPAADVTAKNSATKSDEPTFQEEAPPPIPVFSWTGSYVGSQAGYALGRDTGTGQASRGGPVAFGSTPNGVIGGAHVGYNYAVGSGHALVLGAEGDIDGADYQHSSMPFKGVISGNGATTTSDIKGSVRGRIGYGVDRMLFYGTGGAAFADFNTRYNSAATFGAGAVESLDHVRGGYTLGGGVEYAFMNYLSVRAEYRFTDYGTFTDPLAASAPGLGATVTHRETDSRLQAGFSYKFNPLSSTTSY